MKAKVLPFQVYDLDNVVSALRLLANQIEHDPTICSRCVVCLEDADGKTDYRAFGQDFTRAHAIGICAMTMRNIIEDC